jgi:molecular chaperone DnaK
VGQGERELFNYNKALGEFDLDGIAPAPRGVPQIEVTFDIDANGIMHIAAKDKGAGKENKITIKSDSGLKEEEIQRMVKEAEENAEADKKAIELIQARNSAEGAYHSVKKDFDAYSDQISDEEKTKIEQAMTTLQDVVKQDDVEAINKSVSDLYQVFAPIFAKKAEAEQTKSDVDDDTVIDVEEAKAA